MDGVLGEEPAAALADARADLRHRQREGWQLEGAWDPDQPYPQEPVTDVALASYRSLTETTPDTVPGRVRRGAFSYDAAAEAQRIERGEALIRRVDPGPFEDPRYLALLADQAAALELAYEQMWPALPPSTFDRFLLGTIHSPEVDAFSTGFSRSGIWVVGLNNGLVDFIYQAAKAVVAACDPIRTTGSGRGPLVESSTSLEAVARRLLEDPQPGLRLTKTLAVHFFGGHSRPASDEIVPDVQHPPLSLLIGMAERWVIAHEYGHGLVPPELEARLQHRQGELFADNIATVATVWSAAVHDVVPPEFALTGALFALRCLDVRRRALALLLTGDEEGLPSSDEDHPDPRDRARNVVETFRQYFDVEYAEGGRRGFSMSHVLREHVPEEHGLTRDREAFAYFQADVLGLLWNQARPTLERMRDDGYGLHPMWKDDADG